MQSQPKTHILGCNSLKTAVKQLASNRQPTFFLKSPRLAIGHLDAHRIEQYRMLLPIMLGNFYAVIKLESHYPQRFFVAKR